MDFLNQIRKGPMLLDGALGSMLIDRGLKSGDAPEMWNIEHPDVIKEIQQGYYESGSDIVQTNTFGGNRIRLCAKGLEGKIEDINIKAVEILKEVSLPGRYIAGDIGPTGEYLKPVGNATVNELEKAFEEQAFILSRAGVHLFNIETMVDLEEARAAVRAAKSVANIPTLVSLTFEKKRKGFYTIMGNTVSQSVKALKDEGADGVGANCTLIPSEMLELMKIFCSETDIPIVAKPNGGKPLIQGDKIVYQLTENDFAEAGICFFEIGVAIVGGCCGTTPGHIRTLANLLRRQI